MEDRLAVADAPRRSSDPPQAVELGPGVVRLLNSDTTWADNLVERIYRLEPESEACWVREHTLDSHIDLRTPEVQTALRAAEELLEELAVVRADEDGAVRLCDTTWGFAVLVRRALMTRVRVLALSEVTVEENTSGTIDEIVAHRLGQLALVGTQEAATGDIEVEGRAVLGSDIIFRDGAVAVAELDRGVVLLHLRRGECFSATVEARSGLALQHAKFSAVAAVPVWPRQILEEAPSEGVQKALRDAGFAVGPGLELQRPDGLPVRPERAQEAVKARGCSPVRLRAPTCFCLPLEPLGQLPAATCVDTAVAAVTAEVEDFCEALQRGARQ
jgi:hypothetical protein